MTFSLQGLKKNNTLLHVQTVELLSGGGVSNVMFNSTVSVTGIFSTTTTTTHVPETSEFDLYGSNAKCNPVFIMLTLYYYRFSHYNLII